MSDEVQTPEEREQIERAKKLTQSFASDSEVIGGERLRKLTQGDLVILANANNRFVNGFSAQERAKAERGQILPFIIDIIQWREVCRADSATRRVWLSDASAFMEHVASVAESSPADIKAIGVMFADVLRAYQEIQDTQIEVKAPREAKGQVKKKAPNPQP